jgi:CRP-like cAMP-binding protein
MNGWGLKRFERELLLSTFDVRTTSFEGWVLDRLTAITEERFVRAGDVLWLAGEPVEWLYFMRDGRVRMTREGALPWTFEGRWFLGAFAGRRGDVARRDAVALTDFHALRLHPRLWFALLEDSFELTRASVTAAAGAVARLDARVPGGVTSLPRLQSFAASDGPAGVLGRLALLTALPMARGAGVQALSDLAAASTERDLEAGEPLLGAGEARDHFLVVASGAIEARRAQGDVTRLYRACDVVCGPAAFTEDAREWDAHATTPARVISVPLEAWFDLMEDHFDLAHSFLGVLQVWRERALEWLAEAAGPGGLILG